MGISGWVNFGSLTYGTIIQFSPTDRNNPTDLISGFHPLGCFNPLGIIVQRIFSFSFLPQHDHLLRLNKTTCLDLVKINP